MFRVYTRATTDSTDINKFTGILVDTSDQDNLKIYAVTGEKDFYGEDEIVSYSPLTCVHPDDESSLQNFAILQDGEGQYKTRVSETESPLYKDTVISVSIDSKFGVSIERSGHEAIKMNLYKSFAVSPLDSAKKMTPVTPSIMHPVDVPVNPVDQFRAALEQIITKYDSRLVWNGREKAAKLRTALATITDAMSVEEAFNAVKDTLGEHRRFRNNQTKLPFFSKPRKPADSLDKIVKQFPGLGQ